MDINKTEMDLIKKMNKYIKNCENEYKTQQNRNDFADALKYVEELFPNLTKATWNEMDRLRTKKAIDNAAKKNPILDEEKFVRYFNPEPYKFKDVNWETDTTKDDVVNVKYNDYGKYMNILYSQLSIVLKELSSHLMLEQTTQEEWENITRMVIKGYNYAAEDSGYYMDVIKE